MLLLLKAVNLKKMAVNHRDAKICIYKNKTVFLKL